MKPLVAGGLIGPLHLQVTPGGLAAYESSALSLYQLLPWLQGQVGVNNSSPVDIGAVRQEGQTLWKSLPFLV